MNSLTLLLSITTTELQNTVGSQLFTWTGQKIKNSNNNSFLNIDGDGCCLQMPTSNQAEVLNDVKA